MTVKLSIRGQRDDGDRRATRGGPPGATNPVSDVLKGLEVRGSFDLSPSARGLPGSDKHVKDPVKVEEDDILEFEVEGGFQIWTSAERYQEDVLLLRPDAKIGDAVSVNTLPRAQERGIKEWAATKLRILRLNSDSIANTVANAAAWPTEFPDLVKVAKDLGIDFAVGIPAWLATKALMRKVESRLKPGPALYSWDDVTGPVRAEENEKEVEPASFADFDVDEPILVFIHGTASSTRGSFGAFLSQDAQPQWQALRKQFGQHIYAFEHRTLSESPIDNAIALLDVLPRNARVSIVSHSRGGLVGDLVSLTAIDANLVENFKRGHPDLADADRYDRKRLGRLAEQIVQKQLRVERFVRCASPSRGTLLAAEHIDVFLSVLTNLIGLIPGVGGTPLYEVTKRIALEIVKNRTDPSLVPGLEAMMPTSPLVALLNNLTAPAAGAMGVISGDIEGGNWLKRMGVFASDHIVYEARDNDLVVNTDAMFNGARRVDAGYVFDKGADVSHFNYFRNSRTRAELVEWLAASPGEFPPAFRKIVPGEFKPVPMLRSMQTRSGADQPIVFVLPGIMGSNLNIGDREVWMHYLALLRGGFGDLADLAAATIRPTGLVGDGYRELCEFLQNSHEVIPFAYDWRRSVKDAAALLAVEVESALRRTQQPVRIIAHSMGGLVVRAMISARPDLWDRLCERDGARMLMLGTPNRGSYDIVEALLGTATTVQQLALLDLFHNTAEIVETVAKFPGVLELLPNNPDTAALFTVAQWRTWRKDRPGCGVPEKDLLTAASEAHDSGQLTLFPHADRVHYVAGTSPRTVTGVEVRKKDRVVLTCTTEGDGRVTYASGLLPGVRTWYMDAVHGDLASYRPGMQALQDLLESGTTARLSGVPLSATRGGAVEFRALPEPVLYPTESSLADGILGKTARTSYEQGAQPSFRVSVVHGDLRYARHPIVVGHYEGDTIIGAEASIDKLMRGALSQRYGLGLYPGELGTLAVILRKRTPLQQALQLPSGTIVMGLGKWGGLSAGELSDLLRRAALQYVLERRDDLAGSAADSQGPDTTEAAEPLGLSVLLIGGTSTTNIAIGDSVGAVLRAIAQANRELADGAGNTSTIQEVEIIELYADTAIEAAHAVKRLAPLIGTELGTDIKATPLLQRGREGRRRLTSPAARDAWRRWEVSVVTPTPRAEVARLPKPLAQRLKRAVLETDNVDAELLAALAELAIGESADPVESNREIKFLTLSDRARAEAVTYQSQPQLVERLIKDSISKTNFKPEESRVLFELTVPNELKSGLAQVDNLVLVVDAESATYPWELMSAGDIPLCLDKALVRQLQTASYRRQLGTRAGTFAYVVGDPLVSAPYQQLAGAAAEADAVYDLLRARFEVEAPVHHPTALEVLSGLYKKPYRIVHLAGHGQYEAPTAGDEKARSGMVLDNGLYLTAVEVGQMQQVPELVFLNCCHIGQTGPAAPPRTPAVEFNRLAASVSRELIEMGVRAVVAAGWAVSDVAAKEFACKFYEEILGGRPFGRALKAARKHTHAKFPDDNTWGAYQAYGDPDYRLDPAGIGAGDQWLDQVDVAEFIAAVNEIGRTAESGTGRSLDKALADLDALVKDCPADWLAQTDVQMAIGYAYGRLKQFDAARRYLEPALAGEGIASTTTMYAAETLANFESRHADQIADEDPDRARKLYECAISRLETLLAVAETAERYNLLGGTYKRRAATEKNARTAERKAARASESYRRAHLLSLERKGLDPYPALNWLTLATLLKENVPDADTLMERCEASARAQFAIDRSFPAAVTFADVALVRALRSESLGDVDRGDQEVIRLHKRFQEIVDETAPTPSQLDSVCAQIDVIGRLLTKVVRKDAKRQATIARLADLGTRIGCDARNGQS